MVDTNSTKSPLAAVADTAGEQTIDAFGILASETRLAFLLDLWEDLDPFADKRDQL